MASANKIGDFIVESKKAPNGKTEVVRHKILSLLGEGAFAKCYKVENEINKTVFACKVILKKSITLPKYKQQLMQELKIHRGIRHPNICNFESFFEDEEKIYILLEYCPNRTLNEMMRTRRKLHEVEVQYFALQILKALVYMR